MRRTKLFLLGLRSRLHSVGVIRDLVLFNMDVQELKRRNRHSTQHFQLAHKLKETY